MKRFGILTAVACALLVTLPPGIAYAATVLTYAQGVNGALGAWFTTGYAYRNFDRVYHKSGRTWVVGYQETDGSEIHVVENDSNPTETRQNGSYDKAWCENYNDRSGVTWTCQTTTP